MPMIGDSARFETQLCGRCGGSGWYSFCETWGRTCFQCGVTPHAQGLGRYLTKRGKAARDYYVSLLPTKRAIDLRPGDTVLDAGRRFTVKAIGPSTSKTLKDGIWTSDGYVDVLCTSIALCLVPEGYVYAIVPSHEERQRCLAQALAYQDTLTERGTVRKRVVRRVTPVTDTPRPAR